MRSGSASPTARASRTNWASRARNPRWPDGSGTGRGRGSDDPDAGAGDAMATAFPDLRGRQQDMRCRLPGGGETYTRQPERDQERVPKHCTPSDASNWEAGVVAVEDREYDLGHNVVRPGEISNAPVRHWLGG